jgi:hypothetical protein
MTTQIGDFYTLPRSPAPEEYFAAGCAIRLGRLSGIGLG